MSKKVELQSSYNSPHMTSGTFITGGGDWGVDMETYIANIGSAICIKCTYDSDTNKFNNLEVPCVNNEKGGLISLLFQDSDIHIKNEHYVERDGKFHYAKIDVDHADLVFIPRINDISDLKVALTHYGFSCESLTILQELLDQKEIFKVSIRNSLECIAQLFSDQMIEQIYSGKKGFQYSGDGSNYYHSLSIAGNDELEKIILHNFELIFSEAQDNLNDIVNDHSFTLLGKICSPIAE